MLYQFNLEEQLVQHSSFSERMYSDLRFREEVHRTKKNIDKNTLEGSQERFFEEGFCTAEDLLSSEVWSRPGLICLLGKF